MRYLSLFSGIEAASVAWERLGWECAAVAEIEPFPCKELAYHYPDVPNLGDITQITQERIEALGHIDLVVFGAPCQDLSVAGKRKGMLNDDGSPTRSGLFYAAERIATWAGARWAIYENVPGMFSSNAGADFASVVGEMAGAEFDVPKNKWRNAGVAVGPRGLVEWVTLDAQYVRTPEFARAVPQRRRRVFVVRDSGDWASRPPLFLEPESMCGNPPPSRTPGKTVAHDVAGGLVSSGRGVERAGDTRGQDPVIAVGGEVSHTLSSEGFDASEDGTPIVARCLTTGEGARLDGESCNFIATGVTISYVAFNPVAATLKGAKQGSGTADPSDGNGHGLVGNAMQVRRLTPLECERLQGFPDQWTNIPGASDSARYKALGNSMACNVMHFIGQRINDSH